MGDRRRQFDPARRGIESLDQPAWRPGCVIAARAPVEPDRVMDDLEVRT